MNWFTKNVYYSNSKIKGKFWMISPEKEIMPRKYYRYYFRIRKFPDNYLYEVYTNKTLFFGAPTEQTKTLKAAMIKAQAMTIKAILNSVKPFSVIAAEKNTWKRICPDFNI